MVPVLEAYLHADGLSLWRRGGLYHARPGSRVLCAGAQVGALAAHAVAGPGA
jgi:hypothetical protein